MSTSSNRGNIYKKAGSRKSKGLFIRIYRIEFEDGAAYVGQTKDTLQGRTWKHKWFNENNEELMLRLQNDKYNVKVIWLAFTQGTANRVEREKVQQLKKPLNIRLLAPHQVRCLKYTEPSVEEEQKCTKAEQRAWQLRGFLRQEYQLYNGEL